MLGEDILLCLDFDVMAQESATPPTTSSSTAAAVPPVTSRNSVSASSSAAPAAPTSQLHSEFCRLLTKYRQLASPSSSRLFFAFTGLGGLLDDESQRLVTSPQLSSALDSAIFTKSSETVVKTKRNATAATAAVTPQPAQPPAATSAAATVQRTADRVTAPTSGFSEFLLSPIPLYSSLMPTIESVSDLSTDLCSAPFNVISLAPQLSTVTTLHCAQSLRIALWFNRSHSVLQTFPGMLPN